MNRMTSRSRIANAVFAHPLVLSMMLCCLIAVPATAGTTNWTGSSSSLWTDSGNWDNGVPTSGDIASITGTSGSPISIDLNGSRDIANIALNAQWVNFSNGTLDQNRNTAATFTATDVDFAANAFFVDAGNQNWTRVTRPNSTGSRDGAWNPGNGTQITLNSVSSVGGAGPYYAAHWNSNPSSAAFDVVADNTRWNNWNIQGNPSGSNTGSLTLQNGTDWTTAAVGGFVTGTGTGLFTVSINDSTLTTLGATIGPNTVIETDNATINLPMNSGNYEYKFQINNPAHFDGEGLTMSMVSVGGAHGYIEVASQDIGPYLDGFTVNSGNFSFDTLILQNRYRSIFLKDAYVNSIGSDPEAIYVRNLVVGQFGVNDSDNPGQGLDLAGMNLYYENLTGDISMLNVWDSVGGGSIQQVTSFLPPPPPIPEPSSLLLIGCGAMALCRHGRKIRRKGS